MLHELRQIRAFLAVARLNNFTRAAAELNVSQSALTVQIRKLEDELGVVLFDRTRRHVALTQSGKELIAPLERILVDAEAAVSQTRDLMGVRRGLVTMAVLPSIAARYMPLVVQRFSTLYPGVTARVLDVVADRVVEAVSKEEADFGIGTVVRQDRSLATESLFRDRLCAFVPKNHPMAKRSGVTLRELATQRLLVTGKDSSVRGILENALKEEDLVISPAYEANYMSTIIGLVNSGLGIGILPEVAFDSGIGKQIHRVEISEPVLIREIVIIRKKGRSLSPAAGKMVEVINELIARRS
jgi:LysR family carnitine catabolism transcriptional activator